MPEGTVTRRGVLASAATLPLLTPRLSSAQEPAFVVATFGGQYEQILRTSVIPKFEAEHHVRVVLDIGQGSTFLPRMIAARGHRTYDIVYLNDDEAVLGATLGLWAPDISASLKTTTQLYPAFRPSSALPLYVTTIYDFPLLHRTDIATPSSWGELWNIDRAVGVPHISNSYGMTFLLISAMLNGGSAANLAPGISAIKRLKKPKVWRGVTQGYAMFQQGEVQAGLMYNHRAQALIEGGMPLAVARPKEGVWGQRTGVQVPKSAGRPDLSAAWVDMALGAPYQAAFLEALYSPANATVAISAAAEGKYVAGKDRVESMLFPDWTVINPQRDALVDVWAREVGQ